MTKYAALLAALALTLSITTAAGASQIARRPARPVVGAPRFDVWNSDPNTGQYAEKRLAPCEWRYRLPFYAKVISSDCTNPSVEVRADNQTVRDEEILYASKAGLDYWCFAHGGGFPDKYKDHWLDYPQNNGLKFYLSSRYKHQIHFCFNIDKLKPDTWNALVDKYTGLMKDPDYQTVAAGRPLVYIFTDVITDMGSVQAAKNAVQLLRDTAAAKGVPNPYIVREVFDPNTAANEINSYGFDWDAISAYSTPKPVPSSNCLEFQGCTYSALAAANSKFWDTAKNLTLNNGKTPQLIPIVNTGWDPRPGCQTDVPWSDKTCYDANHNLCDPVNNPCYDLVTLKCLPGKQCQPRYWYTDPTPQELAGNLQAAIDWVRNNPRNANANAIVMYSWSDIPEGGWMMPAGDPTKNQVSNTKLNAIASVLGGQQVRYPL